MKVSWYRSGPKNPMCTLLRVTAHRDRPRPGPSLSLTHTGLVTSPRDVLAFTRPLPSAGPKPTRSRTLSRSGQCADSRWIGTPLRLSPVTRCVDSRLLRLCVCDSGVIPVLISADVDGCVDAPTPRQERGTTPRQQRKATRLRKNQTTPTVRCSVLTVSCELFSTISTSSIDALCLLRSSSPIHMSS